MGGSGDSEVPQSDRSLIAEGTEAETARRRGASLSRADWRIFAALGTVGSALATFLGQEILDSRVGAGEVRAASLVLVLNLVFAVLVGSPLGILGGAGAHKLLRAPWAGRLAAGLVAFLVVLLLWLSSGP